MDELRVIHRRVELDGMQVQASFPDTEVGRDLAVQWITIWVQCLLDQMGSFHPATRFTISGQDNY